MGATIILILAGLIGSFIAFRMSEGFIVFPAVSATLALLFINMPIIWILDAGQNDTYDDYKTPISVVNDSSSVEGHFILGTGSVEGKNVYKYYEPQSDGSNTLEQTDADGVKVFQDTDLKFPYLTRRGNCDGPRDWFWPCDNHGYGTVLEIHVPEGSISNQTRLDAN
jgi:hypothetical protein